jgi:hypothetical protein
LSQAARVALCSGVGFGAGVILEALQVLPPRVTSISLTPPRRDTKTLMRSPGLCELIVSSIDRGIARCVSP